MAAYTGSAYHTHSVPFRSNADLGAVPPGDDPTRTGDIIAAFGSEWQKRLDRVADAIEEEIGTNDALALRQRGQGSGAVSTPGRLAPGGQQRGETGIERPQDDASRIRSDAGRLAVFTDWIPRALDTAILEPLSNDEAADGNHWSAQYIAQAYGRGLSTARSDLQSAGYSIEGETTRTVETERTTDDQGRTESQETTETEATESILLRPGSLSGQSGPDAEELRRLRLSTYLDIRSAVDSLRKELEREVAGTLGQPQYSDPERSAQRSNADEEVADGIGSNDEETTTEAVDPESIADRLRTIVEEASATAVLAASVNPVSAHVAGKLREYARAGVEYVRTVGEPEAQFTTAGDDRVCERCAALEGNVYAVADILNGRVPRIPLHPLCRCTYQIVT